MHHNEHPLAQILRKQDKALVDMSIPGTSAPRQSRRIMAVTICPNDIESRASPPKSANYLEEVHIVVKFLSSFLEGEKLAEICWVCQIIHRKQRDIQNSLALAISRLQEPPKDFSPLRAEVHPPTM